MISAVLVDDHVLFRQALTNMLKEASDIEVVADVATGEQAVEFVKKTPPDLVLMDINMSGMGGIEATRRILRVAPNVKIIAVTAIDESPFPHKLRAVGAHGYVSKNCHPNEFFEAIRTVMVGNHYVSSDVAKNIALGRMNEVSKETLLQDLSPREMQIMMMIVNGDNNPMICERLSISPKTVSTYRHRLYEKLGVRNDVELTHLALRYDVIV